MEAGRVDDLLDRAPCGFLSFGDDGIITLANHTLLDMLDYARDDLIGSSIEKLLPIATRIFYQTHFFPLVRMHGRADEIFLLLKTATGAEIGTLVNASRRETRDGAANDCVLMRVQERQKYEAELLRARRAADDARSKAEWNQEQLEALNAELEQQAVELEQQAVELEATAEERERLRAAAEQANTAKSTFLAMMSHELRTPLNAISGYTQLLEMGVQGPVTEKQVESLHRIQQSQRHLLRLVNEILNLARIESGHIEFDITAVRAADVVAGVRPLMQPQMEQRGVSLVTAVPADIVVACDIEKTQQILLNLLSNAVKFTSAGGTITIACERLDAARVELRVSDTGIGIPADMLETIFDPFVQVEMSASRRGEGTGLGLAISRDLAQGMGGGLTATSEVGRGSTFHLVLPAKG